MSLKTVLVHVDDSERCTPRVVLAAAIAAGFGAELVGVYLVADSPMPPSIASLLPADVVDAALRRGGEAQHAAERRFRDTAARSGVAVHWRAPAGPPLDAAVAHARSADLVVMGQAEPGDGGQRFDGDLLTTTILSSGRPVLVVPYTGAPATAGTHVLIAWDGGREAARAVADAMPFLERARQVTLMAARPAATDRSEDDAALAQGIAYLRAHDVAAGVSIEGDAETGVGERLLSRAADLGADLVVMGAYAHPRLRSIVLGGVTRTMLRAMTVPVLMSH